jgi:hypothetical protein
MSRKLELKNLDVEIKKVQNELFEYQKYVSFFNILVNEKNQKLHSLKSKKKKLQQVKNLSITDGAIISYLEKVCDFDMQRIRESILPIQPKSDGDYIENGWYDMGDFEIHIKKGRVVKVDVEYEENENEK